jgi:hypothetical protein
VNCKKFNNGGSEEAKMPYFDLKKLFSEKVLVTKG